MKKILAILLVLLMALTGLMGCGGLDLDLDDTEEVDKNRTQLYVGVYDGALGRDWLNEYKKSYEKLNPKIQVMIDPKKGDFSDGNLLGKMSTARQDLYFLSANNYSSFVDMNLLEDITTTVQAKEYDENMNWIKKGGTKSIEDAMYDDFEEVYKVDGKYYGLPNWISPAGIVYDADLFNDYGYQIPKTYNKFKELMETMVVDDITPFTFANFDYILLAALSNVWASYEGKSNYELNNSYSGFDSGLGITINKDNAYLLQGQEGKKAALTFAKDVMSDTRNTTSKTRTSQKHREAQDEFAGSISSAESGKKRIAMLLESSYWEPETKTTFNSLGKIEENWGWGKRNFGYMPFPKFTDTPNIRNQANEKQTIYCSNTTSMVCVNKASTQKELAKDFLKFVHSRENLAIYTQYTSSLRPFEFKMTNEEVAKCTSFAKSIYELTLDPNVEFTYDRVINKIVKQGGEEFMFDWKFKTNDPIGRSPFFLFYGNATLSVDKYVAGMKNVWNKAYWETNFASKG